MPMSYRHLDTLINKNKLDEFETYDLGKCQNFEVQNLAKFQVQNYIVKVS